MPGLPADHERFARAALPAYGYPPDAPLRLLSLSENATYLVDGPPLVLRVHRPGYHSADAIRSELAWMAALRSETAVRTPELVPTGTGDQLTTARLGERELHVDAVTFVPGCTAEEASDAIGFAALGEITAQLHTHVQGWRPPAQFTRFRWDLDAILGPQARWGDWRAAAALTPADRSTIQRAADRIRAELDEFGTGSDRFGLVHADLRLANLMVDPAAPDAGITVIDFDDCGWSWHLADLGAVVSWIEDTPAAERIIAEWLSGYLPLRPLPADHLALIPTFVMLRRIQLTAWTASHADADAAIAVGPEFATGTAQLADRYLTDPTWLEQTCSI